MKLGAGTELATEWFDGRTPRPHRVWVRCDGDAFWVRLQDDASVPVQRHALEQIRWPERRSHGLRQVELPDGSLIQHADASEWDAWARVNGLRESKVVGWMQSWRGALGAALATGFFLAFAWVWGLPWLAHTMAHAIPHSVEERIGEISLRQLSALFLQPSALPAAQQAKLRSGFSALVQNAYPGGDAPAWHLDFYSSEALGANAFALPGGQIVITDELVTLLADAPDATLGVLAHELGHVERRHGLDLMVRASLISALLGLVMGDASGFLATVPATLATQAYSRDAEREADALAATLLHASGISPTVMVTFFERLQAQGAEKRRDRGNGIGPAAPDPEQNGAEAPEESVLSTLPIAVSSHPDNAERIRFFKEWTPAH